MRRVLTSRRNEAGNMAVLGVIASIVLVSVLAFGVDQGLSYMQKSKQEQTLDAARSQCMNPTAILPAKFSQDPGREICILVAQTLRRDGVNANLDVWFYELAKTSTSERERVWVVGMQVKQSVPTVFARSFGLSNIDVSSWRTFVVKPYASEKVWRPNKRICGHYSVDSQASATQVSFTKMDALDAFPNEIKTQVNALINKAK